MTRSEFQGLGTMNGRQLRRLLAKRVLTPIRISKKALIVEYRGNRGSFWGFIIFGLTLAALALFFVLAIGRGLWRGKIPLNSAVVVIGYMACILVFAAASYSAVALLLELPCWIRLEADEHHLTLVTRRWTAVGRHALARDDLVRAVGSPDVPISVEPIWNVWLELKDSPEPLRVRIHRSQDPIAFGELMTQLKQFTVVELSTTASRPADAIT